jgi:tripartite-type tricarboxylate transporter receptor subunit TctC
MLSADGAADESVSPQSGINWELREILKLPDIRDKLAIAGNVPMPSTPEQMQEHIERDAARWSRIVDIKGIEKY